MLFPSLVSAADSPKHRPITAVVGKDLSTFVVSQNVDTGFHVLHKISPSGQLDKTFGPQRDGKMVLDNFDWPDTSVEAIRIGPKGDIYLLGNGLSRPEELNPLVPHPLFPGAECINEHFVAKITPQGRWDSTFGDEGIERFTATFDEEDNTQVLGISEKGEIVLTAEIAPVSTSPYSFQKPQDLGARQVVIWWLDEHGRPKESFGQHGKTQISLSQLTANSYYHDTSSIQFDSRGNALIGGVSVLQSEEGFEGQPQGPDLVVPFAFRVTPKGSTTILTQREAPAAHQPLSENGPLGTTIVLPNAKLLFLRPEIEDGQSNVTLKRFYRPHLVLDDQFPTPTVASAIGFHERDRAVVLEGNHVFKVGWNEGIRKNILVSRVSTDGKVEFSRCVDLISILGGN